MFGTFSFISLLAPLVAGLSYDNIDRAATSQAKALLQYIQSQYGSHYISGQQDVASLEWVKQNIGVTPAILGTDLMYYSPSAVANGGKSQTIEDVIQFDQQNGINALVWHWYAPNCLLDTAEQPWYKGFYTEATCFNVAKAVSHHENATDYRLLIRDIDAIAAQLKRLSDADIPVLFRPLHEPEGGWFWWGAQGPAPFKKLWDLLYDRITRVHNIHNLVWVCNTADPNWYPGNDKCDIATVDHYADPGDHGVLEGKFRGLQNLTRGERVLALAEVGSIPDPMLQARKNVTWAYWMTWDDEFIKDGKHNSQQFLRNTFNNSRVVTLDGAAKLAMRRRL
ncbi:family 26 endoglucanase H/Glycosyl hydrolase [Aspergillus californicus]